MKITRDRKEEPRDGDEIKERKIGEKLSKLAHEAAEISGFDGNQKIAGALPWKFGKFSVV